MGSPVNPFVREVPKIPVKYAPKPRCRICRNTAALPVVDAWLAKGHTAPFVHEKLVEFGIENITLAIVQSHARHYIAPVDEAAKKPEDLALLVRNRVVEAVKEGRLEPTVAHGLQAQALLDRRAEKTSDRQIALEMARLLSGASVIGLLEPPDDLVIIEGIAEEVE